MNRTKTFMLAFGGSILPMTAFAHVGTQTTVNFMVGFGHPFSGQDHVLAMLAVGLWAAMIGGRAVWAMPIGFVAALLAGGAIGMAYPTLNFAEPMILASIVFLGLVVAFACRPPLWIAATGIALFGVAHGYAHGAEAPQVASHAGVGVSRALYAAGFASASALLHGVGLTVGQVLNGRLARLFGVGTAAAGLVLAFA